MNSSSVVNIVFEVVNGNLAILRLEFLVFLAIYLWKHTATNKLTWRDWFFALPLGVAVALSLFANDLGEFGRSFFIWMWRFSHPTTPFSDFSLGLISAFSGMAAIGLLLMIRIFSRPFYGNLPWIVCALVSGIYTVASLLIEH